MPERMSEYILYAEYDIYIVYIHIYFQMVLYVRNYVRMVCQRGDHSKQNKQSNFSAEAFHHLSSVMFFFNVFSRVQQDVTISLGEHGKTL